MQRGIGKQMSHRKGLLPSHEHRLHQCDVITYIYPIYRVACPACFDFLHALYDEHSTPASRDVERKNGETGAQQNIVKEVCCRAGSSETPRLTFQESHLLAPAAKLGSLPETARIRFVICMDFERTSWYRHWRNTSMHDPESPEAGSTYRV